MKHLRELRAEIKKTQQQMADKLGISQQAYATYENDKAQPPKDVLTKLADFFDVSVDYLLDRTDLRKPLDVPEEIKKVPVAWYGGAEGLTQEDIDDVTRFIEFVKSRKKD